MTLPRPPLRHSFARQLYRRLLAVGSDERGAAAAFVAIGMLMMLGMVALAVDVGMLVGARTDSQRVADAAALAGAASFLTAPNDADRPRQWAIEYAAKNTVHGTAADVRDEDVDVLMDEKKVRVRVRNIAARSNAIRTVFARVLGWDEVNVGTVAAAEASGAGAGYCPLPLALPDRWTETLPYDDLYISQPPDYYVPYINQVTKAPRTKQCKANKPLGHESCDFTGYYPGSVNHPDEPLVEIKVQSGPADPEDPDYVSSPCTDGASWRCWFQPEAIDGGPSGGGAQALAPWIIGPCPDSGLLIIPGETILYAGSGAGNMQALVLDEFKNLIDLNEAEWDGNRGWPDGWTEPHEYGCAVRGGDIGGPCLTNQDIDVSRVRFMPVVRPDAVEGSGSGTHVLVAGLACVFVDKVAGSMEEGHGVPPPPGQWNVYVRMTDTCLGVNAGEGPLLKAIHLVE